LGVTGEVGDETLEEQTPASEELEQSDESSQTPAEGEKQLTDRGTKVAKEPESRFYQQLKNENADMRRLLSDPASLKEYLRQLEGTQAPEKGQEDEFADLYEKVLTPEGQVDIVKLARYMDERVATKIQQGMQYLSQNVQQSVELKQNYHSDKAAIRQAHPELDPLSESFDPELDQLIGERFIAQGGLQGKVTLKQVADKTFADIEKWRGVGKAEAETEIKRKRLGAISTSKVSGESRETEEENMTPEQILANRVKKAISGR